MATEGQIYLGVTGDEDLISNYAREVTRSFEEIGRSGRTASGKLVKDIVARKYTFSILFEYIDSTALGLIYEKYELDQGLNLKMYISNSTYFTNFDGVFPIVRINPFSYTDFIIGKATKIYKGSSIVFEEV